MEVVNEELLNANPIIISNECTKKILEQMKKNIGKIKIDNKKGTGFFCKIPFPDKNNMIPVFITNNHVINNINEEILIYIEEECQERKMLINNDRKIYMSDEKKYDITIFEIKEEDNIKHYLELDEKIIDDVLNNDYNKNDKYIDQTVYIIQYPEGKLSVSYGLIQNRYEDKRYDFQHSCSTRSGSSGSPILNLNNNKIIGIHKKGTKQYNIGAFLNEPIKEFINQNFNNKITISNYIENYNDFHIYELELKHENKKYCDALLKTEPSIEENISNKFTEQIKFNINMENIFDNKKNEINNNLKNKINKDINNNISFDANNNINFDINNNINFDINNNEIKSSEGGNKDDVISYNINKENGEMKILISEKDPMTKEKLDIILDNLLKDYQKEKLNALIMIHEKICDKSKQNKEMLIPNINKIITVLKSVSHKIFYMKDLNTIPIKFAKYLLIIFYKLASNKELISHLSYNILLDTSRELLRYLLIDGLDDFGEGNIIFKSINSTMLRILENCDITLVISALLELIKEFDEKDEKKLVYLSIKCLKKTTYNNIAKNIDNIKISQILLQIHLLLLSLQKKSKDLNKKSQIDIIILNTVKYIVEEFVKYKKEKILEEYSKSVKSHQFKDKFLHKWIMNELKKAQPRKNII